jgi:hypothetical protein
MGGVPGLDDASAGCPHVVQLCEQVCLEPLVFDPEARGRTDVPRELLLSNGRREWTTTAMGRPFAACGLPTTTNSSASSSARADARKSA